MPPSPHQEYLLSAYVALSLTFFHTCLQLMRSRLIQNDFEQISQSEFWSLARGKNSFDTTACLKSEQISAVFGSSYSGTGVDLLHGDADEATQQHTTYARCMLQTLWKEKQRFSYF